MADNFNKDNRALAEQHLHRGLDYYDRQELEQALAAYEECVRVDPTFAMGYNNLGMTLIDLERYDEALFALQQSIRSDPTYAEAYNNLGFILRRLQHNVEAAAAYVRFLELEPDIEESARIREWIETVMKENGLTAIPPFTLSAPEEAPSSIITPSATNDVTPSAPSLAQLPASDASQATNDLSTAPIASQANIAKNVHCELCLRLFPESEIQQHEGKVICSSCLAIMGATPTLASTITVSASAQAPQAKTQTKIIVKRNYKGLAFLGALSALVIALSILCCLGKFNPILQKFGVLLPPQPVLPDDEIIEQQLPQPQPPQPSPPPETTAVNNKENITNAPLPVIIPIVPQMPFNYELSPALDLSIGANKSVALTVADLNSDGLTDLIVAAGEFSRGWMRVYLQRLDNPLPTPTLLTTGGRFSTIYAGDLDGNNVDVLLATNYQSGELVVFHQEAQQLMQSSKLKIGPGPVALAVGDMDNDKKVEIATLLGMGGCLVITTYEPAPMRSFSAPIRVPLPLSGAQGNVFAWNSAGVGPGFLVVLPLAEKPLQYVAWNKGQWNKGGALIASDVGVAGLIVAAAPLNGATRRLAVAVSGETCQLLLLAEQDGQFAAASKPLILPALARNLLTYDFNGDKQEDLFVIGTDQSGFYFATPDGSFVVGPQFHHAPQMLGPAVIFRQTPQGPELLLLDVDRKGHLLKPSEPRP